MTAHKGGTHEQVEVIYRGRVQGVGFRYTVLHLAEGFTLTGFVRNEWDGSVCLTAEGERAELERFLRTIMDSRLDRYIQNVECRWRPATGQWTRFAVAF